MRYYSDTFPNAVAHVSPSVSLFTQKVLTNEIDPPKKVLDLGAGNGRNSLALAKRFGCLTTLVDSDPTMLEVAVGNFVDAGQGEPAFLCCRLEELATSPAMKGETYDVVIMSYVLHHIKPTHYESIIEFCRTHLTGHLLIDVYWNRFRCAVGQFVQLSRADWYGLTYEELAKYIAPHFLIESDRIQILPANVTFNLVCSPGLTSSDFLACRQFDYSIDQATLMRTRRFRTGLRKPEDDLESVDCIKCLAEYFPGEWQLAKSAYEMHLQELRFALPTRLNKACCFLLACRQNGFPLLLREYEGIFRIKSKKLLKVLAQTSELRSLGAEYFTQRIIRFAALPGEVEDLALKVLSRCEVAGESPAVSAGTAVLVATRELGISITKKEVADLLQVSPMAILSREKKWGHNINQRKLVKNLGKLRC